MERPKMILFDYGQTLITQQKFDGIKGTQAVLDYAVKNKWNRTAAEVQMEANKLNQEMFRGNPATRYQNEIEVHTYPFQNYLYESQGIELSIDNHQIETVFWDNAAPGTAVEGIIELIEYLKNEGIRTGVISNLTFSRKALEERICRLIPNQEFEFIITSSEYVFRKPNRRIFELALVKASLEAKDVWYCGDDLQCDIVGAQNCGIQPVWFTGALDMKQEPVKTSYLEMPSWRQFIEYLEKLKYPEV